MLTEFLIKQSQNLVVLLVESSQKYGHSILKT